MHSITPSSRSCSVRNLLLRSIILVNSRFTFSAIPGDNFAFPVPSAADSFSLLLFPLGASLSGPLIHRTTFYLFSVNFCICLTEKNWFFHWAIEVFFMWGLPWALCSIETLEGFLSWSWDVSFVPVVPNPRLPLTVSSKSATSFTFGVLISLRITEDHDHPFPLADILHNYWTWPFLLQLDNPCWWPLLQYQCVFGHPILIWVLCAHNTIQSLLG